MKVILCYLFRLLYDTLESMLFCLLLLKWSVFIDLFPLSMFTQIILKGRHMAGKYLFILVISVFRWKLCYYACMTSIMLEKLSNVFKLLNDPSFHYMFLAFVEPNRISNSFIKQCKSITMSRKHKSSNNTSFGVAKQKEKRGRKSAWKTR